MMVSMSVLTGVTGGSSRDDSSRGVVGLVSPGPVPNVIFR